MIKINEKCKVANLFRLLEEKNISSVQLSKDLGISTGNISDWKSGRATPKADKLVQLAEYLGTTSEYLLGLSSKKQKNSANTEFSEKDIMLVEAYHKSEPVIQSTVDRLLGIEEKTYTVKIAARDGSFEERVLTETEWKKLQDLPDADL